jgi:alpha-L-rhamnosidase
LGQNWEEDPFMMKDIGDRAFCAGLTRNVLCFYVHQPDVKAFPGYQWEAADTHFDSHITWWNMSHAWLGYLARCQHLLRQGRFVADFLYYYGEDVPNYVAARSHMNPPLPAGFDCDTINAEALLGRLSAKGGRLRLPDGMSYQYLVLPNRNRLAMSPAVCRTIAELVKSGATVIGPAPQQAPGLSNWPQSDAEVQAVAGELWGRSPGPAGERQVGRGRVIWGRTPAEVVAEDRLAPDVEFRDMLPAQVALRFDSVTVPLDWIHRREGATDIYFVANISTRDVSTRAAFRADGRQPELWDAVTGRICALSECTPEKGCTAVPLKFKARQSFFVVFGKGASARDKGSAKDFPETRLVKELTGPWEVSFNPDWGGPPSVVFERLEDWTKRSEDGIRYYSGTATYRKRFELSPSDAQKLKPTAFLDLGVVRNLARVRLNGHDLNVVWTTPWQVEITAAVKSGSNALEIEVVNLWPNRLIGDARLPKAQRRTVTNVEKFNKPDAVLLGSGLLGPVTVRN